MVLRNSSAKEKILDAALWVVRAKGYTATTVDEVCAAAGVTKGSFFHHFKTKEQLALEAAQYFSEMADSLFNNAPYQKAADPLERVLGYLDFRAALIQGELPQYTCLLGMMVQEVYDTYPEIRKVCDRYITAHTEEVLKDLEAAKKLYRSTAEWDAESLSLYFQSVLQGAFVLAKAKKNSAIVLDCLAHLRRYVQMLFAGTIPGNAEQT